MPGLCPRDVSAEAEPPSTPRRIAVCEPEGLESHGPNLSPCGWPTMPRVAFHLHHVQVWSDCVFFKHCPLSRNAQAGMRSGCRRELMLPMTAGDGSAGWALRQVTLTRPRPQALPRLSSARESCLVKRRGRRGKELTLG